MKAVRAVGCQFILSVKPAVSLYRYIAHSAFSES